MKTRTEPSRRSLSAIKPAAGETAKRASVAKKAVKLAKRDEFSTGRGRALRERALATAGSLPGLERTAAAAPVGEQPASVTQRRPVYSFDTATYLSKVGNPPEYRITQQQCDVLRNMGMKHGVIGIPTSTATASQYAAQMDALRQEVTLLNANGIKTDTYLYMNWRQGNGQPKTNEQVRAEMMKALDSMDGLPLKTFWFDVEVDSKLNPSVGAPDHQRMLDAAYEAFNDWKAAHPGSTLEFGIYTSKSIWQEHMVSGPNDPFATKYADLGVPLWEARYPSGYDLKDAADGLDDMRSNLGEGFGGWSVDKGNVRGWQYRGGEHDGYQPTFTHGLDRNVWLDEGPDLPITAIPSGSRDDLPVTNQALADFLAQDAGKPVEQRQYKTMQDIINAVYGGKTSFAKLGLSEADAFKFRWEDPWKAAYGLPFGTDQFASTPRPPAPPAAPPAVTPPTPPTAPVTPPVTPPVVAPEGSPIDLIGLARGAGAAEGARIKQLQDTMTALGYLEALTASAGYGSAFGPKTEAAVKAFQKDADLAQTGVVDRATAMALANRLGTPLGFDADNAFAPTFGLARGATAAADRPAIKQLQDALIAGGYVPESLERQSGYGTSFGPITEAGLEQFQQDNGLPPTGIVDGATVTALADPRARTAGFAAGVALAHRDQLGLPTGPAYTAEDGSLRQDFDHGSVWVTKDRVLHAELRGPDGVRELTPPRKLGTAQSLEEAKQYFLSQWGPTEFNDPPGNGDIPWGYMDCGPTSALMTLSALGLEPRPDAANAYLAIDAMRDTILGYDSTKSLGLSLLPATRGTVGYGLVQSGAEVTGLTNTLEAVDGAMARGNPVIVGTSTTWEAWGRAQAGERNYLNARDPDGHFVVVLGRSPDGNYLIGDPLLKGGPIEVTPAQLQTALNGAWSNSTSLAEVSVPEH